jgi:hypothetical protein
MTQAPPVRSGGFPQCARTASIPTAFKLHIHFMKLGAFFAAPIWKRRKKPGYPLVSFARRPVTGQKDTASIPCAFHIRNRFLRGKIPQFH